MSSSRAFPATMSDEIVECLLPYVQDARDRAAISMVCRQWFKLDSLTRRRVTIALCYTTTPQQLLNRFPNLYALKLKGKLRAAMFNLIPSDWGGYVKPWVDVLGSFPRLNSLHFRRMIIKDSDLEMIASVKGPVLQSLELDKCSGFSTDGLVHIARSSKDMKSLILEESDIEETSGDWFHQLALNNKVLVTLNFYLTFLEQIRVEDLELLAKNCPLKSVKVGDTDLAQLVNFFRSATTLEEFCGGSFSEGLEQYSNISFPSKLTSVGLMYLGEAEAPLLYPKANLMRKLDLVYASLSSDGHCELLRRCPNLEVLETTNVIGDRGLEVVSLTCKRLKRLRIERGEEQGVGVEPGTVTRRGLVLLAHGCPDLEYIAVYVSDVTNEALENIGAKLKNLNDFRLVLIDTPNTMTDMPLDNGVRALLQGCQKMRRFALYVRQGALTDVGLRYIGQNGQNIKWILLGYAGESDAGLLEFSRGCPKLQKLEIRACCFTERGLAIAARQLVSLKYLWVQGYRASQMGIMDLLEMARPYWNIELIPGDQYDDNNGDQPVRVEHPSHIVAYYSLAGQRTDHPNTVHPLAVPEAEL